MNTLTQQTRSELVLDDAAIQLIKNTIAKEATNDELQLFLYQAKKSGLDPLAKQIYLVKRQGKMAIQTSIDGFRLIAARSGDYAGQDKPEFIEESGLRHPKACTVTVYRLNRLDQRVGFSSTVFWDEYVPAAGQDFMWTKMPHTMLAKVAESQALRKAFPQELGGLYTSEEVLDDQRSTMKNQAPSRAPQTQVDDVQNRAESWLAKMPGRIKSVMAADGDQFQNELKLLVTELEDGRKHLTKYPVLTKKIQNYLDELKSQIIEEKVDEDLSEQFEQAQEIFDAKEVK